MTACEVRARCQPECGNSGFVYLACHCSLHSREEWDESRHWQGFITGVGSVEVLAMIKYLVKTGVSALEKRQTLNYEVYSVWAPNPGWALCLQGLRAWVQFWSN